MVYRLLSSVRNNIALRAEGLGFVRWAGESRHSVATQARSQGGPGKPSHSNKNLATPPEKIGLF